jgi:hypothetical protein
MDSKNGAVKKKFSPSYFGPALVNLYPDKIRKTHNSEILIRGI